MLTLTCRPAVLRVNTQEELGGSIKGVVSVCIVTTMKWLHTHPSSLAWLFGGFATGQNTTKKMLGHILSSVSLFIA